MYTSPHPAVLLTRLLDARPVDRSFDRYPAHWRALLNDLAAVPAHPRLRAQALPRLLSYLPEEILDQLVENIQNPDTLLGCTSLNSQQEHIIAAVSQIGPATASEIAFHMDQDISNVRKRLLTLVSLGLLRRFKEDGRICYQLQGL